MAPCRIVTEFGGTTQPRLQILSLDFPMNRGGKLTLASLRTLLER